MVVQFAGRPLPGDLANSLVEGYVDDSRTLPDLFVLRFRDPSGVLLEKAGITIGTDVDIGARAGGGATPQPLLTGSVTALELEIDDTGTFTVVRGMDASHRLLRGRRVAGYQNMTLADICARVARRAGLSAGEISVAGPVLEHVAQPNITDWEFLNGLAHDAGAHVHVSDGKVHITKPTEAGGAPETSTRADKHPLVLEAGDNLLRCRAAVSAAEQVSEVEVRGWDVQTAQPLVGHAPAGRARTLDLGITAAEVTEPFGEAGYVVTDTAYGTQAEVDQAAKALAERIAGSFAELEAVIRGNPEIRAGTAVTLGGVGAPFAGRYTVASSRHVFDARRGYETWVTVSGQQERSLFGLTGGGQGGALSAGGRCSGLVNGTVTDTKDPDGLGRVKVRFPWLSDEYASGWARTAQAAGTGGGAAFIPEVGDEVLVGFEQGHLDRPYVLAALYNGKDKPSSGGGARAESGAGPGAGPTGTGGSGGPGSAADGGEADAVDPTSGAVTKRGMGSRAGDRLELLNAANGPQGVRLATGDGKLRLALDRRNSTLLLHSDGTVEIDAKESVTLTAGSGVSLDAGDGTLELAGESVRLTARSGVQLNSGNGPLKLGAGGSVEVTGDRVAVKGTSRTEIKDGQTVTVSAPMVRIN
ncbi:hypothetical protein N566_15435 [Streptomycetaceae bacterium MP113-05]|nr:hypothetical protein N566_15435 [Streptomycetaceae bacterium MP113-05]